LFLKRIYKEWRALFWILLVCGLAQVFFMAKGIQNIPFFLYNMYSKPHPPLDSFAVYLVKLPGGYYDHKQLTNREQEMLLNSVGYFENLLRDGDGTLQSINNRFAGRVSPGLLQYFKENLYNDSNKLAAFPQWWARYFKQVSGQKTGLVSVVKSYVTASAGYPKSVQDSVLFTVQLK
jgi:hypothetical protein